MPDFICRECQAENNDTCTCYEIKGWNGRFTNGYSFGENKSKRHISCELEISDCTNFTKVLDFCNKNNHNIVYDGSIEGDFPFEINTCPISGDSFLESMKSLSDVLIDSGCDVNDTCGYHVHVNSKDLNYYDIRKFAFIYVKIEDYIFKCIPEHRRHSDFCYKCKDTIREIFLGRVFKKVPKKASVKGNSIKRFYSIRSHIENERIPEILNYRKREKYFDRRYWAMNFHSWFFRGSLENRCYEGTIKYENIVNWGMFWATIIDFAVENCESDIKDLPEGYRCLEKIFGEKSEILNWLVSRYIFWEGNI